MGQPIPLSSRGSVLLRDSYVNVDLEEEKECRVGYTGGLCGPHILLAVLGDRRSS